MAGRGAGEDRLHGAGQAGGSCNWEKLVALFLRGSWRGCLEGDARCTFVCACVHAGGCACGQLGWGLSVQGASGHISEFAGGNHRSIEEPSQAGNHLTAFLGQAMPWEMGREGKRKGGFLETGTAGEVGLGGPRVRMPTSSQQGPTERALGYQAACICDLGSSSVESKALLRSKILQKLKYP